jgi:TatD DNase family protein
LIVHTRAARADTIAILREEGATAGVMHCFTEDWDMAKAALDIGFLHLLFRDCQLCQCGRFA